MTETFDLAAIGYARWKRAVDLLVREGEFTLTLDRMRFE